MSAILPPKEKQPLINRRLFKRGVIAAVLVVIVGTGIWITQTVKDFDFPAKADTAGEIAAIEYMPKGYSQAVLIKPDGTIIPSPGYKDGVHDHDPVWRPDGNRLFFASDREPDQVNLYRWNPASNKVERRTATKGTYSNLNYASVDPNAQGLVSSGGMIVGFDPVTGDTTPILPPSASAVQGSSDEGKISSIEGSAYSAYGTSFKSATWFDQGKYIVSIMRGDNGDTLLMQDMSAQGKLQPPAWVAAGDRIDMDVNAKTGAIVFTIEGFRFDPNHIPPDSIKDNKVVTPFRHMVGILDPAKPTAPLRVAASPNDANAFGSPVFAPDGNSVIVSVGVYKKDGDLDTKGLLGFAASQDAVPSAIHKGAAYDVSFSPDSKNYAFVVRGDDGMGVVHLSNLEGSSDQALTAGKGNFGQPRISPQVKQ